MDVNIVPDRNVTTLPERNADVALPNRSWPEADSTRMLTTKLGWPLVINSGAPSLEKERSPVAGLKMKSGIQSPAAPSVVPKVCVEANARGAAAAAAAARARAATARLR